VRSRALSLAAHPLRRVWRAVTEYEAPATPLIAAARRGLVPVVERLLDAGADVEATGRRGRTALHDAAARGRAEAAALLLARGADVRRRDRRGRAPLDASNVPVETLHAIRQRYHRRRTDRALAPEASDASKAWAAALDRDGIVKVPGLVAPALLAQLRDDFEGFVAHLEATRARGGGAYRHYDEEEHVWEKDRALVGNNAFKYSPAFARLCGGAPLVDAATRYLGRPPHVQRGGAMRYLPSPATSNDMFGWHHDLEEQRFKVMLLLTGVGGDGQHMSYVRGSHRLFHPYRMFRENACGLDYVRARLPAVEIFDAMGEAGDAFLFDSNGAHRGNRREGAAVRDVLTVEYSADRSHIWGGNLDPRALDGIGRSGAAAFERFLHAPKPWDRPMTRSRPTWVEHLPHVERWLDPPDGPTLP